MLKRILAGEEFEIAESHTGLKILANISFAVKTPSIKMPAYKEKRTEVLQINLTPSELSLIGKETGSDIGRLFIQKFIKNNS